MSSFEQALYRVYERSLDVLHADRVCSHPDHDHHHIIMSSSLLPAVLRLSSFMILSPLASPVQDAQSHLTPPLWHHHHIHTQPCIHDAPLSKPSTICHFLLHSFWTLAILFLSITSVLQYNFVGDPGCLKLILDDMELNGGGGMNTTRSRFLVESNNTTAANATTNNSSSAALPYLQKDEVMKIKIIPITGIWGQDDFLDGDGEDENQVGGDMLENGSSRNDR